MIKNDPHPKLTMSTFDKHTDAHDRLNVVCDCGAEFKHSVKAGFVVCPDCHHEQATISLFVIRNK